MFLMAGMLTSLYSQSVWNGNGTSWGVASNWTPSGIPGSGADVQFGPTFTAGTAIDVGAATTRTVGTISFTNTAAISLNNGTLTINTGITRASSSNSNVTINSAVSLPSNIAVALDSSTANGQLIMAGAISGAGQMSVSSAASVANSLRLDGNNTAWSGGLNIGAAAANSGLNINSVNALGSGNVTWGAGSSSFTLAFTANASYTLANNISVTGDRTINPIGASGASGRTTAFNGNITGTSGATIRFTPRSTDITNNFTELNGVNTNTDAASRMIFYGSTHNTTSALGNTYLIGNNQALDWGRIIIGQASTSGDEIAVLYKNGITISKLIELNDSDNGAMKMGVYGTGASAVQSGNIQLTSFSTSNYTKTLKVSADSGSTFTVSGNISVANAGDTLGIDKIGDGTAKFTNSAGSTYNGNTSVSAGTLLINNTTGSGSGTGNVTVAAGATLAGGARLAPTAGNTISVAGTLSPGDGVGTMTLALSGASKLDFASGAKLALTLGTSSDLLTFSTSGDWVTGGSNLVLDLTSGSGFAYGHAYTVITNLATDFAVAGVSLDGQSLSGSQYTWTDLGNSYQITVVPEPATGALALAGAALAGMAWMRRRQVS